MDSLLVRLRREAEEVAAAAVTVGMEVADSGSGVTESGGDGGGKTKMDEVKDKLMEEIKKCKYQFFFQLVYQVLYVRLLIRT